MAAICLLPALSPAQEEQVDLPVMQKIKEEEAAHSQVPLIAHYLTDVAGSRLTNSPGYKQAAQWAVETMQQWGLQHAALEPWGEFGKGWSTSQVYVAMKAPYYHPLIAYPKAWSAGTPGLVSGKVVLLDNLSPAGIEKLGDGLKGSIVMLRPRDTTLKPAFTPYATRYADTALNQLPDAYMVQRSMIEMYSKMIKQQFETKKLLASKGAVALLSMTPGTRDGTITADGTPAFAKGYDAVLPEIAVSTEDFLRLRRLLLSGHQPVLELNIQNNWYTDDLTGYNVIAEIPGTDKKLKDQVVMIGGHLDSWHSGTGATDNAAGCVVMMETMRILKALGIQPKRTIRIALWGGEEQGLLGSFGYVKKHFGNPATMQLLPEQKNVSVYFNLDNGSGKIRGIYLQNNEAAAPVFKSWLQPFADMGATGITQSNTGSTDHLSFDAVGIPGFQFIQDPLEYETRTHHTNMDTYDHLQLDDLKQAATIVAAFVYNAAMRPEMFPRKPLPKAERFVFDTDDPL